MTVKVDSESLGAEADGTVAAVGEVTADAEATEGGSDGQVRTGGTRYQPVTVPTMTDAAWPAPVGRPGTLRVTIVVGPPPRRPFPGGAAVRRVERGADGNTTVSVLRPGAGAVERISGAGQASQAAGFVEVRPARRRAWPSTIG